MSLEISVNVAGAAELKQALAYFDVSMQRRVQKQLAEWAVSVKTEAERLVPVRTGYLKSSIYTGLQYWTAQVGAEAEYAAHVEFGTAHAAAQPFLRPALQALLPTLEPAIANALDTAKAEAGL